MGTKQAFQGLELSMDYVEDFSDFKESTFIEATLVSNFFRGTVSITNGKGCNDSTHLEAAPTERGGVD